MGYVIALLDEHIKQLYELKEEAFSKGWVNLFDLYAEQIEATEKAISVLEKEE